MTDCKSRVHWVTRQISINEKSHWDTLYLIQVTESPIWFFFFFCLSFSLDCDCVCVFVCVSSLMCVFLSFSVYNLPNIPRRIVKSCRMSGCVWHMRTTNTLFSIIGRRIIKYHDIHIHMFMFLFLSFVTLRLLLFFLVCDKLANQYE